MIDVGLSVLTLDFMLYSAGSAGTTRLRTLRRFLDFPRIVVVGPWKLL